LAAAHVRYMLGADSNAYFPILPLFFDDIFFSRFLLANSVLKAIFPPGLFTRIQVVRCEFPFV